MDTYKYTTDECNALRIFGWLKDRGGILIWPSVDLSNPGASTTTPALGPDGVRPNKPNWRSASKPSLHITDLNDVGIITAKEVKRFHVAVRMGSQGLSLKVTDGGSRRIYAEVAKAEEKYGVEAWHEFDYGDEKNAVIMIADKTVSLADWIELQKPAAVPPKPVKACGNVQEDQTSGGVKRVTCNCGSCLVRQPYMDDNEWNAERMSFIEKHGG